MPAAEPRLDRIQQHLWARFEGMGLSVRAMPDGASLLVRLPLGPAPFESVIGPLVFERIVFATVGLDRIKCLQPQPVFGLPLLDVRDCTTPTAIEAVLRRAWRERTCKIRDAAHWLAELGIEASPNRSGTLVGFPLAGESPDAQILMQDRHRAILPGTGPLSGLDLASASERVIELGEGLDSSADLECLIATRIDSLRRNAHAHEVAERTRRAHEDPALARRHEAPTARPSPRRRPRVLVVGPKLIEDAELRNEFKRQGYRTATARGETEALVRLASMTPDLVISEYALGRSDGATLLQATRSLAGIEVIPAVLLDETAHDARREAARAVGAAGYLILPSDKSRFVTRLGRLLDEPKMRRFTRYPGHLAARLDGFSSPCLATEVGRGGVYLTTEAEIDLHSEMLCEIVLPELKRHFRFEGEVLYRTETQGVPFGLGIRFSDISPEDEAALIEYLFWLEGQPRSPTPMRSPKIGTG